MTSDASRSLVLRTLDALLPSQHRRRSRRDVLDQRLEAPRLTFAHVERFLCDDEEVVDEMRGRRDVEWNDFAGTADGSALLLQEHLLSRLVARAGSDLNPLPQLRVLFLKLLDLRSFILSPHDGRQRHRLEYRREEVVQAQEERILVLLREVNSEVGMFLRVLAELEVKPILPLCLRVNFRRQLCEELSDPLRVAIFVCHHQIHFEQPVLQLLHSLRIVLLQLAEEEI